MFVLFIYPREIKAEKKRWMVLLVEAVMHFPVFASVKKIYERL